MSIKQKWCKSILISFTLFVCQSSQADIRPCQFYKDLAGWYWSNDCGGEGHNRDYCTDGSPFNINIVDCNCSIESCDGDNSCGWLQEHHGEYTCTFEAQPPKTSKIESNVKKRNS